MEIDALLLLKKGLKDFKITESEFLVINSYVNNNNVNINLSIRDNALSIVEENESLEDNAVIADILNTEESYVDVPIYSLFLQNVRLRTFLISAPSKRVLTEETVLNIVEVTLQGIDAITVESEIDNIIGFLMEFLHKHRLVKESSIQKSQIINGFVKKYESVVITERDRKDDNFHSNFYRRMLLYKLFSCNYATFDYNQILNPESEENGVETIVRPLLDTRSYGHLRLMINNITLSEENVLILINVIKDAFKSFYERNVSEEDIKKDKEFIDKINVFLKFVNGELLDYVELSNSSIKVMD